MSTPTTPTALTTTNARELAADARVLRGKGSVFTEEDVDAARQRILAALYAKKPVWDNKLQTVRAYVEDYPTQVRAAELLLAYAEGTPVQRVIHANSGSPREVRPETLNAILSSDAGREALAIALAQSPVLRSLVAAQDAAPASA